jgi:thymidylate synthase (FAD)
MPNNTLLEPKKKAFANKIGQVPLTVFKDYRKTIKVTLMNPEPEESMMNRIYSFVKATWADSPEELENATKEQKEDALNQMLSGKALGLGLETVNLTFTIAGISHIDAQQITRQRVGVTFSAQCTGDRFLTHNDVLVEECIAQDKDLLHDFIMSTLKTKMCYSHLVNSGKVSIQAARCILPRNIETFYNMNTNLSTLMFFHQKRIENESQTWQMNEVAQQMADEVCKAYPQLKEVFERNKKKFKFQKEAAADRKNSFSTSLYIPKDDEFEYNDKDFLYPKTKGEMHYTNTPIETSYYWGFEQVNKGQYETIKTAYDVFDKEVHENNWSNELILSNAYNLSLALSKTISIIL